MAESLPDKSKDVVLNTVLSENQDNLECAVCLQPCVHPAELPCGHIFCYLCIKGIVNQGRRCAMCRQDIPIDYLENPRLLKPFELESIPQAFEDGHQWFYEGHNGWWQYDERTSLELEAAYQKGDRSCELLVAGLLYIADFDSMHQYRRHDMNRRRRIKRDLATTTKKGVAGLKVTKDQDSEPNTTSARNNIVSSILVPGLQNLHISNSRFNRFPRQRPNLRLRRNSFSPTRTYSVGSDPNLTEHMTETDERYNSELDTMIHDTLDWTIQQIESLQFDLTNDYDTLTRDVDEYEQLQTHLSEDTTPDADSGRIGRVRLNRSAENVSNLPDDERLTRNRLLLRSRSTSGFSGVPGRGPRVRTARTPPQRTSSLRHRFSSPPHANSEPR